jgi:hypothetical protein
MLEFEGGELAVIEDTLGEDDRVGNKARRGAMIATPSATRA